MEKLNVAFLDFWPEIKDENIFLPILQKHFEVEVTTLNPDVVIHSIFGGMKQTPQYKCKKILFIGENYRAKNYGSNYSISFDPHSDTNYRLPLWQFYLILRPELQQFVFNEKIKHNSFDKFCSFTVSNPNNFVRNGFLQTVSAYKPVSSYGRYMTNDLNLIKESQGKYWRDAKYNFFLKRKHKFSICFEHSSYPGYTTEKLMDAFLAGSLPIYWGDPKISEDWNCNAFLYPRNGLDNEFSLMKELDTNNVLFNTIYNEPIFTDEQKQKHLLNIQNFEIWLINKIKE
jgi:alpha(1,3/1,4) fucosyltransferase